MMLPRPAMTAALRRAARPKSLRLPSPRRIRAHAQCSAFAQQTRSFTATRQSHFATSPRRREKAAVAQTTGDDAVQAGISKAIKTAPVVLFMKGTPELPQCGFSRATVQVLGLQGVDPDKFTAFDVLEDEQLRAGIKKFSDWPTIPQLYVDGEFVGGCDIVMSMHQDGSLAKLLGEKGVVVEGEAEGEGDAKGKENAAEL